MSSPLMASLLMASPQIASSPRRRNTRSRRHAPRAATIPGHLGRWPQLLRPVDSRVVPLVVVVVLLLPLLVLVLLVLVLLVLAVAVA